MPYIQRPDGAQIHFEVAGQGFPLLLIAPGGVSSEIAFWDRGAFNPMKELANDFMVIGMDQRHAGTSYAPARPFSYADAADDQLAVLNSLGVDRFHVMGGCIGCAYIWNLIQAAPGRVAAAVPQNPVGLDETNSMGVFTAMFHETMRLARAEGPAAVAAKAKENPLFVMNNAAGPFAPHIAANPVFYNQIANMPVESYVALIVRFRDGIWPDVRPYFTATDDWMKSCQVPLLVCPGNDAFHPASIGERIARDAPKAQKLPFQWNDPARREDYVAAVRGFLKQHTPSER